MRIIFLFIVLSYFTLPDFFAQTTYYLDASGGSDNNNGTSRTAAWQTLSQIKNFPFQPGDKILLKRGEVWNEQLRISASGIEGSPITIGAYGSSAKPIITVVKTQDLIWENTGNNIWRNTTLEYDPKRVLKDGVEILDAAENFYDELGTNVPDLVEWYYGPKNTSDPHDYLYLYSSDSPANHTIEFSAEGHGLIAEDISYVIFENLEIVGGYYFGISIFSCSNLSFKNVTAGEYANFGVYISSAKLYGTTMQPSDRIVIDSCIIDSGYKFNYSEAGTAYGKSNRGPPDGYRLNIYAINCELKNSLLINYAHANVSLFCELNVNRLPFYLGTEIANNKIYNNKLTSPDLFYGGRLVIDGYSHDNEIFNNIIENTSVKNQFNGFANHFHHNIIRGIKASPLKDYNTGYGISIQGYYDSVHDNIFENNLIVDCEDAGILISGNNGAGNVINNIFRNNIIYNCGTKYNNVGLQLNKANNTFLNHGNYFQNNLVFNPNTAQTINFYGSIIDVNEFNSQNSGVINQMITGNIDSDPKFNNYLTNDYHLQSSSPCIDAGANPQANIDFDGNPIPLGIAADIGIYEFTVVTSVEESKPSSPVLIQNYPNPFNPVTKIRYSIPNYSSTDHESQNVRLTIYDILGKEVAALVNEKQNPGNYEIEFKAENLPSGFYICLLTVDNSSLSRKMILLK